MSKRDFNSWAIMIAGYADNGEYKEVIRLFVNDKFRYIMYSCGSFPVSWIMVCVLKACGETMNVELREQVHGWLMKSGYSDDLFEKCCGVAARIINNCKEERFREVFEVFNEMGKEGVRKNSFTLSSVLSACSKIPDDGNCGEQVHANAIKLGLASKSYVQCGLVNMYGKFRLMNDAKRVFDMNESRRNRACWNAMLTSLVQNGCLVEAIKFLYQMRAARVQPQELWLNNGVADLAYKALLVYVGLCEFWVRGGQTLSSCLGLASGRACLRVCVSTRRGDNLVTSFSFLVSLFAGVYEEQPLPSAPVAPGGQHVAPEILVTHTAWVKGSRDSEQELLQTTRDFHSCKQEEGQSVSSITNMLSLGKTVKEYLHASMLKLMSKLLICPKNNAPALHAIRRWQGKPYTHQVEGPRLTWTNTHDVCGPLRITSRQEQATSSLFTDDFSRFMVMFTVEKHVINIKCLITFNMCSKDRVEKQTHNELGLHLDESNNICHVLLGIMLLDTAARFLNLSQVQTSHLEVMCLYIDAEEHELGDLGEPANYKAALLDPESDKWLNAMNGQMQSMKDKKFGSWLNFLLMAKPLVTSSSLRKRPTWMELYTPIKLLAYFDYEIWQYGYQKCLPQWISNKVVYREQPEEAEYIAAFDASKEAVWVRKFIFGLGVVPTIEEPINMYCDNTGAITIANESGITKGARHFPMQSFTLPSRVFEFGGIKLEKFKQMEKLSNPFYKSVRLFPKHSERY
ncbi:pentatricopeptide repeat-containing protein [Tanacetum coccineum]